MRRVLKSIRPVYSSVFLAVLAFACSASIVRANDWLYDWIPFLFSQNATPGELQNVRIDSPGLVYGCKDEKFIQLLLQQTDEEVGKNLFQSLMNPDMSGNVYCEYSVSDLSGEVAIVVAMSDLIFVREAFVVPEYQPLGEIVESELSVRLYQNADHEYFLLAHPKVDGVYQDSAVDYLHWLYGQ